MFSTCSERPSLTIPSSYTALSPLHVTSHDRDIHSTLTRRVCTTDPLYEGLVIVLPLAASIAPGMPSGMWRPIINMCSVPEWVDNEWLDCLQTTRIATMPIVKCWNSNPDLMSEDLCMFTSSAGDSDGHWCLRRAFLEWQKSSSRVAATCQALHTSMCVPPIKLHKSWKGENHPHFTVENPGSLTLWNMPEVTQLVNMALAMRARITITVYHFC